MENRIYNFSAGPAILPEEVLLEAQKDFYSYKGSGMCIMEMSHRGKIFDQVFREANADLRKLLNINDNYAILFLQGGATLQFSMVPLNLMPPKNKADYIVTGAWAKKSVKEAKRVGTVNIAASTENENFVRIPKQSELKLDPDASSDYLHKMININKYGLIYAGAQKNIGPAGVVVVIIRKDLLERSADSLHTYMNYKIHVENDSLYNTPTTFGIYIAGLVFKWLLNMGGLDAMYKCNLEKAKILYDAIDASNGFYKGTTVTEDRSLMNVTYVLPNEDLTKKFIEEAKKKGMDGIKGHRSVGGIRASIYNAFPKKGVEALVAFMDDFRKNN